MQTKEDRLKIINQLILEISKMSRGFFYSKSKNKTAEMILEKGRVFFVDDYSGKKIYAYNTVYNTHRGFSHGGTIWGLINDFREFIVTGGETDGNNGYGGLYCTHWGVPEEEMKQLRQKARELGYLQR
jgi:hypothetical protein